MVLEFGSISKPDPIRIIERKLEEKISAGGKLTELISLNILGISSIPITKLVIITTASLEKKSRKKDSFLITPDTERKTKTETRRTKNLNPRENFFSRPRERLPTMILEKKSSIKTV